jgi:spore coat protein U-like protein
MNYFMGKRKLCAALFLMIAVILCCAPVKPAKAGSATATITVTATVLTACIVAALPLVFGNYDPTSASAAQASTTITAVCTLSAPYSIALDNGTGGSALATGGAAGRKMTAVIGSTTLGYNLYQDSSFANVWGNSAGTTLSASGSGLIQSYSVFGRIPPQQTATAGAYLDTVTATLTF